MKSRMVTRYTLVYITDRLTMFIQNIMITTTGIFQEELLILTRENCFYLLLIVCYLLLSVQLNFVVQSVLYSGAYLSDRHQI